MRVSIGLAGCLIASMVSVSPRATISSAAASEAALWTGVGFNERAQSEPLTQDLTVDAGADQTVNEGAAVQLEGITSGSGQIVSSSTGVFDASTGLLPDASCTPWARVGQNGPPELTFIDGALRQVTGPDIDELLFWIHSGDDIDLPATLVIEATLRVGAGTTASVGREHANIGFTLTGERGNTLNIGNDVVFTLLHGETRGAEAFVDTNDAFHTYRIELNSASGLFEVFQDGVLILEGSTFESAGSNGTVPRVYFGDGTLLSSGTTRWRSVTHNAYGGMSSCVEPAPIEVRWDVVSSSGPPIRLIGADTHSPSFVAPDDGQYVLRMTATAGEHSVSDDVAVTVDNVAPVIGASAAPTADDGLVMVSASVTDPGILDAHSATIDWGDGSSPMEVAAATQGTGWAAVQAGHVYDRSGSYSITVTVADDDGGVVSSSAQAQVGAGGLPRPEPGFALWGQSEASGTDSVRLSGSGHQITGTTHSNSQLRVSGSGHSFQGQTEYVRSLKVTGSGTAFDPAPAEAAEVAFPVPYSLGDYQPGGRAAVAAGAAFFDLSTACGNTWSPDGPLHPGLYWVPCDVAIAGSSFAQGPVTIAAAGEIKVTGSSKDFFGPFVDGVLFISGESGNNALRVSGSSSTFAGMLLAPDGQVRVTGSGHTFECGLFGDEVRISGSNTSVDAGRCGLSDPDGSLSDGVAVVGPPLVVPELGLTAVASPADPAPGTSVSVAASVSNSATTLVVPGLVALMNSGLAPATVDEVHYELEVADQSGVFTVVASTGDGSAMIVGSAAASTGASYPADGGFVGSSIAVDGGGVWAATAVVRLDPVQLARLLDPAQSVAVRSRIDLITSSPLGVRQITRFGGNVADAIRDSGASLSHVEASFTSAQGAQGPVSLGSLAPGEGTAAEWQIAAPGGTARGTAESELAYSRRLRLLNGRTVGGVVSAKSGSSTGTVYAPSKVASAAIAVPVLGVSASAPTAVAPGETSIWSLTIANNGSALATDIDVVVDAAGAAVTVAGLPPTLAPGAVAEVMVEAVVPETATLPLPLVAELRWSDAAGNVYGPVGASSRVWLVLPAALDVTKTAGFAPGMPSGQLGYQILVTNTGTDSLSGVVLSDTPDSGVSVVAGSVTQSLGTVTSGNGGEATVTVDIGSLAGGETAVVEYLVDYTSLPPGQSTISNQATVSSVELPDVLSDDPAEPGPADPTIYDFGTPPTGGGGGGDDGSVSGSAMIADVAPADGSTITEPVDVSVAAITPAAGRTIDSWQVVAFPAGGGPVDGVVVANGSGDPSNSVLGEFDPTVLANGVWIVRVEVTDSAGAISFREVSVVVDGQLKLGRYAVTYEDVSVSVSGIPMRVLRTYDTLDRSASGAFGHGWSLELANIGVQSNRALGLGGWTAESCGPGLIFVPLCFTPDSPRFVTVTWPDGRTETFDFTPTGNTFFPIQMAAEFTPRPGVTSTLEAVAGDESGGLGADGHMHTGGFGDGPVYAPQRFVLTAKDGAQYLLDAEVGLVSVTDRSGNTVTVDETGIRSSQGPEIVFVRDGEARITSVIDPAGNVTAYGYDAAGDLVSVTDANGNVTSFGYVADHYLDEIDDPGPGPWRTLGYDADGRLASITDANGNVTSVSVDPDARTEIVTSSDGLLTTVSTFDERGNAVTVDEVYDGSSHVQTYTYDSNDLLLSRTDPLGNSWAAVYDGDENLLSFTDAVGNVSSFTYDGFGFPTSVTDAAGETTTFAYDGDGSLTSVTNPLGDAETFTYDAAGRQLTRTDELGRTTAWAYDANGRVASETDPAGETTTFTYDGSGRVASMTDALGATTSYSYDGVGNLVGETDPLGRSITYGYDGRDLLTSVTDAAGEVTTYVYDAAGQLTSTSDATGRVTTHGYADGRLVTTTAPDGGVTTYGYDGAGRVDTVVDPLGRTTSYGYDAAGRRTSVTRPVGSGGAATDTMSYDGNGRVVSSTNSEGETSSTVFDAVGRVVSVTDGLGRSTVFGYDALGRQTSVTNGEGETSTSTFDAAGQLTASANPLGEATSYTYTAAGYLDTVTDPLGRTSSFGYDGAGRRVSSTDALGRSALSVFDAAGQLTSVTSAEGVVVGYGYDPRGLVTSVTDGLGNVSATVYDAAGRVTVETDANANATSFGHDAVGRVASMTDALGGVVGFGHDVAGQRTSITDPNGETRTVGYDDAGNVVSEVDELGRVTVHAYDSVGRRTSTTDARGVTIGFSYDAAGQLVSESSPDGAVAYGYDGAGRRVSMTDPTGSTVWAYDGAGRVTSVTAAAGSVSYGYDAAGQQTSMVQPGGTVSRTFDVAGGLASLTDATGTASVVTDGDGRTVSLVRASGVTTTNGFDAAGRLTSIIHTNSGGGVIESYAYGLDGPGNRVSVATSAGTETFGLDALNRLVTHTDTAGAVTSFGYDAAGNRTSVTDGSGTVTYTVDAAGQLVADSTGVTYSYDATGNLTATSGGDSFSYDAYGRTVTAVTGGVSESYGFDADGVRVTVDGVGQLWDRTGLATLIGDGNGGVFTHGPGGVHAVDGDHVLTDAVGSVEAVVDGTGSVVGSAEFGPFGTGTPATVFGFAGEQHDSTGLIHLRARQYVPGLGRFTTRDPVQPGGPGTGGFNHYTYAVNNPSSFTDPSGRAVAVEYSWRSARSAAVVAGGVAPWTCDQSGNGWWKPSADIDARCAGSQVVVSALLGGFGFTYTGARPVLSLCARGGALGVVDAAGTTALAGQDLTFGAGAIGAVFGCLFTARLARNTDTDIPNPAPDPPTTPDTTPAAPNSTRFFAGNGPLDDGIAATFRSGTYDEVVLSQDTLLYRVYGGEAGPIGGYWSRTPPTGPMQAQMDLALNPEWGNLATDVATIRVPAGTTIYEGAAAAQSLPAGGSLLGGGNQVFIPNVNSGWLVGG